MTIKVMKEKQRDIKITKQELIDFEYLVSETFEKGSIRGPVHLSYGNEDYLIDLFQYVHPNDWVFSTWRNHYHALLHGVPRQELLDKILDGKSISFQSPEHNFYTSAIVNGMVPIAVGTALGIKLEYEYLKKQSDEFREKNSKAFNDFRPSNQMVWCFVGDMTAESGVFYEALKYSIRNELPIHFVIENNGLSTNTPTQESWGTKYNFGMCDAMQHLFNHDKIGAEYRYAMKDYVSYFEYKRENYPHVGIGKWIHFAWLLGILSPEIMQFMNIF